MRKSKGINKLSLNAGVCFLILGGIGCSHNPNKAEKVQTELEKTATLNGETQVGVKEGQMVVQKKVLLNEELRRIQNEVYELEDRVYGNRKYGSLGLYGVLRDCRFQLSEVKNGGDGKLQWTEPLERVTDKEEELKFGVDEKERLVALNEEFLTDRIQRFQGYKKLLHKRQDEYQEKVEVCKLELKNRKDSQK